MCNLVMSARCICGEENLVGIQPFFCLGTVLEDFYTLTSIVHLYRGFGELLLARNHR